MAGIYIRTKAMRTRTSKALVGHIVSEATRSKLRIANLGKVASEEAKTKIINFTKGGKRCLIS